jgi:hypothetical protein
MGSLARRRWGCSPRIWRRSSRPRRSRPPRRLAMGSIARRRWDRSPHSCRESRSPAAKALEGLDDLGLDADAKASFLGGNAAGVFRINQQSGSFVSRFQDFFSFPEEREKPANNKRLIPLMARAPRVQSACNAAPSGHKSGNNSVDCCSATFTVWPWTNPARPRQAGSEPGVPSGAVRTPSATSTCARCVAGMDAAMGEGRGHRSAGARLDGAVDERSRASF